MDHFDLFESTKAAFAKRQSQGKRYNYPKMLRQQALELLSHYPINDLSGALGISAKCLRNWQAERSHKPDKAPDFIPLILSQDNQEPLVKASSTILLKLPHGIELLLPETSSAQNAQLICTLIKELSSCSI